MLRILGGPKRLCDGLTRRDLLQSARSGCSGWAAGVVGAVAGRGRRCAPVVEPAGLRPGQVVHPAVHVRLAQPARDVRPQARGAPWRSGASSAASPSSVPGLNVCERLPRLAQVMDKVTADPVGLASRTRSTGSPIATTGIPRIDVPMELNPRDPNHWPFIGSVVDYVDGRRPAKGTAASRRSRATWCCPGRSAADAWARSPAPGPYGGFLGQAYDPICDRVRRQGATKTARKTLADKVWEDLEPYRGITPESRFQLGAVVEPPARS